GCGNLSRDARGSRDRNASVSSGYWDRAQYGRRGEGVADWSAAAASGLPCVQAGKRCTELASAPTVRRTKREILNCRMAGLQDGILQSCNCFISRDPKRARG